jgi:gamma-glutamyl phosphate reductase
MSTTTNTPVVETARAARLASVSLQSITNEQKNEALLRIKQVLNERREEIFRANEQDKKVCNRWSNNIEYILKIYFFVRLLKS